jgi:hypothetical protein
MDLNLPIGTSIAREDCSLPKKPSVTAAWLTSAGLLLRGLVWSFAALFAYTISNAAGKK